MPSIDQLHGTRLFKYTTPVQHKSPYCQGLSIYFESSAQFFDLLLERQLLLLRLALELAGVLLHLAGQLLELLKRALEGADERFWVEGVRVLEDAGRNDVAGELLDKGLGAEGALFVVEKEG